MTEIDHSNSKTLPMLFFFLSGLPKGTQDSSKCLLAMFVQALSVQTNLFDCQLKGLEVKSWQDAEVEFKNTKHKSS